MIPFTNDKEQIVLLKPKDICNVFDLNPDRDMRVINFLQGSKHMELWTSETLESIQERLEDCIAGEK